MRVTVFVVVVMRRDVGMGIRMGVRMTVRARRRANRDRHDSLVGYAAAFTFGEHSQLSHNATE